MKKIFLIVMFLGCFCGFSQTREVTENSRTTEQDGLFGKAINKLNGKKYTDAIKLFNELIQSENNKQTSTYYYLAQAYFENKQYNECVATCSKGLELGPKENLLNLYRAQANIELGNTATVCDDLKKSATQDESLLNKYCH